MNDSIFHAQTLQTEVFRSARRLVEIEKYFVHRIPTGDDLVDLLIADCLPQNRKSPEQFGTGTFLLELFHGPTLAFKDVAMQLLARLMDHALAARGERTTIVVATSGDTGGAAVDAFRGRERADLFVLFP